MVAHKITIKIRNDEWYQMGKHLIVKQMQEFKVHQICIIKDEETVEVLKQIIEDDNINESFIALETNHQVEKLL